MNTFSTEELVSKVRDIASTYPNQRDISGVISRPQYVRKNARGCLLGEALVSLGVPESFFRVLYRDGFWETARSVISWRTNNVMDLTDIFPKLVAAGYIKNINYAEREWLCNAQSKQDIGSTWKGAVRQADLMRESVNV